MKQNILILSFVCILSISPVYGAEENRNSGDVIIPPGMETIKEGNVNIVVPKGGQLRKQNSVLLIETADEYASRKFSDTEEHFKRIEKELETQKKELEVLKGIVKKADVEKNDPNDP
ncbi:MAG: hypothetical protein A3I73_00525 [Omnitrophica bacterium RIFCSPLOWO2_02_FULL_45_16]|nr:MAG: hypothetical protein A3C51_00850 [Omnitrophica bacterium RIFCSPHIGHO2_02_FULL_46_20]OGW92782.1 MAG: hypothetical protein A3K16_06055 [Omnitrophica bacterium RIFCSPLOWO2_01_FULL_45_24]OGW93499.1 MAG: hypothetical protein A3G36_02530 [Omnitrophica bacterium RIFCSPLOWO2_12_FULL_45_13]OGX00431.1 MAG: hypothetical protein A3I73_00525 [Omnitrophica bacterium RIFCSPLOWO2_02_FULL_45_16]